jgi:hypothetical protein
MIVRATLIPLLLMAAPAHAAERNWGIGSFDRLRVDGPFEVRVTTGGPPRARAQASDPRVLERLSIEVRGGILVLRLQGEGWAGLDKALDAPPVITLSSPTLSSVTLFSGSRVTVAGMKGARVALSVTGSGVVAVSGVETEALEATLIGTGSITAAGRASRARLSTNGPGSIDAAGLDASDLFVSVDGAGETRAKARYTAQIVSNGLGRITVGGSPKCTVRATAGGPVRCGEGL